MIILVGTSSEIQCDAVERREGEPRAWKCSGAAREGSRDREDDGWESRSLGKEDHGGESRGSRTEES